MDLDLAVNLGFTAIFLLVMFGVRFVHRSRTRLPSVDGFPVRLVEIDRSDRDFTRLLVKSASKVSLSGETAGIRLVKAIAGEDFDIAVGDPGFDRQVHLRGPEDLIVACLGFEARKAILALVAMGGEVKPNGDVHLVQEGRLRNSPLLKDVLAVMAKVAKALSEVRPDGVANALAGNAARDPVPGVRLRNLRMLLARHRDAPAARAAVEAALGDSDPQVRLCAATFAKDPAALRALVADAAAGGGVRAEALRNLHDGDPQTLLLALDSGEAELQAVALHAVAIERDRSFFERVLALAESPADAVAEAAAKALGAFDGPLVQPALLRLLAREAPAVRRAAAWSLGQAGSVEAVEPLLPLLKQGDEELRDTARLAIRRIQGRLGPVEEGRLSVALAGDEGALSVAPEEGALSLRRRLK